MAKTSKGGQSAHIKIPLAAILNAGNGLAKGISNESGVVAFEPLIAPISDRRALNESDEKPNFSLKNDRNTFVFGVDDVFTHGKRDVRRRLNSAERYTSPDYFMMLDVLLLQVFASWRGNSKPIDPTIIVTVPVEQYNNADVVNCIRDAMCGDRTLVDYDGCELRITIKPEKFAVQPESTGAIMHWAFDANTLEPRESTAGTSIVIDTGFETTNTSMFEGLKFQRERGATFRRAGMSVVAQAVTDYIQGSFREADVSRIDKGLRAIAGKKQGEEKRIEIAPGLYADVTDVYDQQVGHLANKIADSVRTKYTEAANRALLVGGGPLHIEAALRGLLPFPVQVVPDPDNADLYGLLTALTIRANKK